jgi:hypothetical protein
MNDTLDDMLQAIEGIIKRQDGRQKCGARTRTGGRCAAPGNGRGDRCKLHGGKSTGPKTEEGKERSRQAVVERWRRLRAR